MTGCLSLVLATAFAVSNDAAQPGIDDQNCSEFPYQADAQAHLRADPSDPDNLDGDNDGIACESLPCSCDYEPLPRAPHSNTNQGLGSLTPSQGMASATNTLISDGHI